jgi:hypothetical protein
MLSDNTESSSVIVKLAIDHFDKQYIKYYIHVLIFSTIATAATNTLCSAHDIGVQKTDTDLNWSYRVRVFVLDIYFEKLVNQ